MYMCKFKAILIRAHCDNLAMYKKKILFFFATENEAYLPVRFRKVI